MRPKILALVENTIGTKLLLSTRLNALGYRVTILSAAESFRRRIEAEAFDWIILDEAAVRPVRRRLLEHVRRDRQGARIVWLGRPPQRWRIPIEASFSRPLHYAEIVAFFSRWAPRDAHLGGDPSPGDGVPCSSGAGSKRRCLPGGDAARKYSPHATTVAGAVEGGDKS